MIIDVIMPKMGESIVEGTIIEWRKQVGDSVEKDELFLAIGTDKVDSEIPSTDSGIIVEILAAVNDVVDVGSVIARIETNADAAKPVVTSPKKEMSEAEPIPIEEKPIVPQKPAPSPSPSPPAISGEKKFFTPVVNKIAAENNIGVEERMAIPGSGKGGRVTKVDILKYLKTHLKPSMEKPLNIPLGKEPIVSSGVEEQVEMDHMRKLIAGHMRKSIDTAAHVYVVTEVDMSAIVQYVNERENDFYIKKDLH